jgi:hypothetical protein
MASTGLTSSNKKQQQTSNGSRADKHTTTSSSKNNKNKVSAAGEVGTSTRRFLSAPQLSFFLYCYVWCTDIVQIILYKNDVCAEYFIRHTNENDLNRTTCHELTFFFLEQYRQAIITTVGFIVAMTILLCWQNNPLHQRMNLFIAQGLGATLLVIVTLGDVLIVRQRVRMFLSILAVVGSIFVGVRSAGIQTSRPLHKLSPINIWMFLFMAVGSVSLLCYALYGPNTFLTDVTINSSTAAAAKEQRLLFYLTIVQHFTRIVLLPLFAVFYLDTIHKKITLIFVAIANIYHFLSMSTNRIYIRHYDTIALFLLTTAVLSINVAFLPEEMFTSSTTAKKANHTNKLLSSGRRPKKRKM